MIVGSGGKMMITNDGGYNWNELSSGTFSDLNSISFINENTGWTVGTNGTILKTTDGGLSWITQISNIITGLNGVSFVNANTGTAVGNMAVVLRTTNGGDLWYPQNVPVSNVTLFAVSFPSADYGVCVGGGGTILRTTTGGDPIGIQPIGSNVPKNFYLYQNYPNPFNPSTKIRFDVTNSPFEGGKRDVKLIIYNALGKEVEVLIDEQLSPGTYEVEWSAADYPSGIYFYKLQTGNFVSTKKMILLK
jgi:hypothetical protein